MRLIGSGDRQLDPFVCEPMPVEPFQHHDPFIGYGSDDAELVFERGREEWLQHASDASGPLAVPIGGGLVLTQSAIAQS
jgi:hypothetical protein